MSTLTLSGKEIARLAAFAGLPVGLDQLTEDELEAQYLIKHYVNGTVVHGAKAQRRYHRLIAWCLECPEDGVAALDEPIDE